MAEVEAAPNEITKRLSEPGRAPSAERRPGGDDGSLPSMRVVTIRSRRGEKNG
jgi:hypothetical protein